MGECILLKSGGGNGSSDVTATKNQLLAGYTAITNDSDDDPIQGTIPVNSPASNQALNCGGAHTVKQGYHPQAYTITANSLASQTSGTAAAGHILSGKTAWVSGSKITGTIPSQGAATITPGTSNKTAIAAGRYASGAITVAGNTNLVSSNIKKGVTIFGVTGTMEPLLTPSVLINGSTVNVEWGYYGAYNTSIDSNGIALYVPGDTRSKFRITTALNLTGWNFLKVNANSMYKFYVYDSITSWNAVSSNAIQCAGTSQPAVLDIRSINGLKFLQLDQFGLYNTSSTFRIKKVELTSV